MTSVAERDKLLEQLKRHEGLRLKPYTDTTGHLTIGYGRNLAGKGISREEATVLLEHDMDEAITDCSTFAWFVQLDGVRQRAIVDFRFNLGPAGFRKFRKFLAAMEAQNYTQAVHELGHSLWAKQVGTRADEIMTMIGTGVDPWVQVYV